MHSRESLLFRGESTVLLYLPEAVRGTIFIGSGGGKRARSGLSLRAAVWPGSWVTAVSGRISSEDFLKVNGGGTRR